MVIPLISAEECSKKGGRGKTKGEKYGKYKDAIEPSMEWIHSSIKSSKDGFVRVKVDDIAKEMGADFVGKNPTSITWGLKFVLFSEGIVVDSGTHKDGSKLLVMRNATPEDKLPPSLTRYIDLTEDEEDEKDENTNSK